VKTANEKPKPAAVINGTSGMIGEALVEQLYEIGHKLCAFLPRK